MEKDKTFWFGFAGFGLIIILAFSLNGLLDIAGFESTYRESMVNQFTIQGEAAKNNIETALSLGKKLYLMQDEFDELFYDILRDSNGIRHFYVTDADGKIIYTTRIGTVQSAPPFSPEYTEDLPENSDRPPITTVKVFDAYYICIPLYSSNRFFQGTLMAEFSQETISAFIYKTAVKVFTSAFVLILASLVLYFFFSWVFFGKKRAESIITIVLLLGSQAIFSIQNNGFYNTSISDIFSKNMLVLARSVTEELQKPLDYGIKIDDLGGAREYLLKRIEGNPQCSDIYVTDINLNVLYEVRQNAGAANIDDSSRRLSRQDADLTILPLVSIYGSGYLVLRLNRPMITGILRDIAMDSATIIVVALIFAFLLKDFFAFMSARRSLIKNEELVQGDEKEKYSLLLIKIGTFLFMFAAFETLSFIPLFIQDMYKRNPGEIMGLSEQTVISLPVSIYMFGIMLSMLITLFALKKVNIWKRYIIITLFFIAGSAATIFSDTMLTLMIARFITGLGFGGMLLNTASIVIQYTTEKNRSVGFGTNAASFAAASICSIPVGGIIVNKFGYAAGIWVSIGFAVIFFLFSLICMRTGQRGITEKPRQEKIEERFSFKTFFRILCSKHIVIYILCINIPFQLIYVGLFQFLLPIYMNDSLGLSQGNIGRILSIFSIVSLGAVIISRLSDMVKNDKVLLSLGAIMVGIVLLAFGLYPAGGMLLFIGVLVGMGLDNLSIDSIEEVYISSGNIKNISEENLLQSYKVIEKIISVFIPTLTGMIIAYSGFSRSMIYIGIWCLFGAIVFLFLGKNGRWGGGTVYEK